MTKEKKTTSMDKVYKLKVSNYRTYYFGSIKAIKQFKEDVAKAPIETVSKREFQVQMKSTK